MQNELTKTKYNNNTTLVHIYIPQLNRKTLGSDSVFLVGTSSIDTYSGNLYSNHCIVSIYGAHKIQTNDMTHGYYSSSTHTIQRKLSLSSNKVGHSKGILQHHVLGSYIINNSDEDDNISSQYTDVKTDQKIWISFTNNGFLQRVVINNQVVPLSDVILLEYDPVTLVQCLKISKKLKMSGLPDILIDSFTLVKNMPEVESERNNFQRLIPFLDKNGTSFRSGGDNEKDTTATSDVEEDRSIGVILKNEAISRCLGIKQIGYRCSLIWKLLWTDDTWLNAGNMVLLIMLDIFLGTCLTLYLRKFLTSYEDFENFLKIVLEYLLKLLDWLNGAPAGLKLNRDLNSLFHSFYSYHLHLWEGYIGLLEPLLRMLFHGVVHFGFLGLTIQLAMAKDLLSLTTFHIYCLYIYVTRLFNVQLETLKSLGRLFFGRKWNPLRHRFDHVTLSLSEMFLGAFGFTVAFFLLPTICIYYVVFLFLRLPLLLMESSLKFLIQVFDSLEILTAFLTTINSQRIANEVYLKILPINDTFGPSVIRYEIHTQTSSRKLCKIPNIRKPLLDTFSKILDSRIITQ